MGPNRIGLYEDLVYFGEVGGLVFVRIEEHWALQAHWVGKGLDVGGGAGEVQAVETLGLGLGGRI